MVAQPVTDRAQKTPGFITAQLAHKDTIPHN